MQARLSPGRSWRAIGQGSIGALALIALCFHGAPGLAQSDTQSLEAANPAVASTSSLLIDVLLQHVDPLQLSPDQTRQLHLLRLDLQVRETQLAAERRGIELQMMQQQAIDPKEFKPADEALRHIEELDAQIERARHDADQQARELLTPDQRGQLAQPQFQPPSPTGTGNSAEARLDQRIDAAIDRRLKDTKVVEYETSEAIVNRLKGWATYFGVLLGIPLTILAGALALLGFRTYDDFKKRALAARDDVNKLMESAREELSKKLDEAKKLEADLTALRGRMTELSKLEQSISQIAEKVDRIEEAVGFRKSKALTPELQKSLEGTLSAYRTYLTEIGFPSGKERVTVFIDPKLKDNAYYEPNQIVIAEALAGDPDVVLREYTHHVLKELQGEDLPWTAIQSGLSDYLPCSFNDNPKFAEKSAPVFNRVLKQNYFPHGYVRTMDNQRRFAEISKGASEQEVGEVWGGAFWEIRALLDRRKADPLLLAAWKATKIKPDSRKSFIGFARKVVDLAGQDHGDALATNIQTIFEHRGLEFPS